MGTFKEDQKKVAQARKALEKAELSFYMSKIEVQKSKNPDRLSDVKNDLATSHQVYFDAKENLSDSIATLYANHQFKQAAAAMDASIPILFLPLRLETRFATIGTRTELWVRIYPDDIHVHSHEPLLTDNELNYGRHYWISLLTANREAGVDKETNKEKAWESLSTLSGVQRALWIVKQTKPTNWTPTLSVADGEIQFPSGLETKTHDWTRAPRSQVLPDKFAVSIIKNDKVVKMQVGGQVPDTVFLGPDPFLAEEAFKKEDGTINFDDSFSWITDFDQAVKQGLGLKMPLESSHFNTNKIDKLVVMGLLSSASPEEGKELLEQLIENHHYSHKGFSFMPQMSPTNNTEETDSAYTKNEDYFPKKYYDGSAIVDLDHLPNAEGNNFAEYLGIKTDVLHEVNHSGMVEAFEAAAMNKVLYPSTIGYFLEVLADPVVSKSAHPKLRDFFTNYVTATGPMPCIRVGDQPYGTLLTSDLGKWAERDGFYTGLHHTLSTLQEKWDQITSTKVSHVGRSGDPGELMLNILGLNAGSVAFKHRLGHLPDVWHTAILDDDIFGTLIHKQSTITTQLEELGFKRGEDAYPYISNLSFFDYVNNIPAIHLVDGNKPSETRFLQKGKISRKNYIETLASINLVKELDRGSFEGGTPRTVLFLLMRHAILQELKKAAEVIYNQAAVPYKRVALEKSLYNFSKDTLDLSEWEVLFGVPSKVDSAKLKINEPIGDYILKLRGNSEAAKNLKEMREAMAALASLSTAKLHKHLTDHIDLCTYRLDAWEMGLFYRKLLSMRKDSPEGIYLGAYGFVENLQASPKSVITVPDALKPADGKPVHKLTNNAGFVHTPSLNHATAAGVLLSGYHNHASKSDPSPFSVNLSSERVRRALLVLEGTQNNQRLEALLGYQFERALHDITTANSANNLNQYILPIRDKFPILARSIPQQGTEAQEVITPFAVVDGLKIINATAAQLRALVTNDAHAILVLKEKDRLEDTLDALNDLMVSEAAFQATQGKTDRTAAILNSLKNAVAPPELEVNQTPRSTHLSITNRVVLHFDAATTHDTAPGWSETASPRSSIEPGLNHWLGNAIGNPTKILCTVSNKDSEGNLSQETMVSLSELQLQPIDLVFTAGDDILSGAKDLENRITKFYLEKVSVPLENKIQIKFEPDNIAIADRSLASVLPLVNNLKRLVTTARPAHGKDYSPQSKKEVASPLSLYGYNTAELRNRVTGALTKLKGEVAKVNSKAPNGKEPKNKENPANFAQLFEFHTQTGFSKEYITSIEMTDAAIDILLSFLQVGNLFGAKVGYPEHFDRSDTKQVTDLVAVVSGYLQIMNKKIALADEKLALATGEAVDKEVKLLMECGRAVLGDDFKVIPTFTYNDPTDVASSMKQSETKQLLKFISEKEGTNPDLALETWMESVAQVRPNVQRLEQVRMIAEAQAGVELKFTPAQLPYKEKDSWLAVEFPEIDERTGEAYEIKDDTLCLAVHGETAIQTTLPQSALLVDEWTEFIPNQTEITGVAYNYDQPNATSPNTLLLAVEPTGAETWNWDVLTDILEDTFKRARSRAVEPAQLLEDGALDTLSPMTVANFDLHKSGVSLDYLVTNNAFLATMQAKNFELYSEFKS